MAKSKIKKIVVGIDYTKSSENALNYACLLAERSGATIVLLHVFDFPLVHTNSGLYVVDFKLVRKLDLEKLEKVKAKTVKAFPHLKIEAINTTESLKSFVKNLASKKQVDYVVLGLETKSNLAKFLQGTTGVTLSAKIDCPVIIVPEKYIKHELEQAVITVDNRSTIKKRIIDKATQFTKEHKFTHELLHIKTDDEFLMIYEKNTKKENAKWAVKTIEAPTFDKGLAKYIKENSTDLIIIFSRSHSAIYNLFNESNTKRIAFQSKIPVITIHEKN